MRSRFQSKTVSGAPGQFPRSRSPSYSPGPSPDRPLVQRWRPFASNRRRLPLCSSATTTLPSSRRTAPVTLPKMYSSGPSTMPTRSSGSSASVRSRPRGAVLSTVSWPASGGGARVERLKRSMPPPGRPKLVLCMSPAGRCRQGTSISDWRHRFDARELRRVYLTRAGARLASGTNRRWLPRRVRPRRGPTSSSQPPSRARPSRAR